MGANRWNSPDEALDLNPRLLTGAALRQTRRRSILGHCVGVAVYAERRAVVESEVQGFALVMQAERLDINANGQTEDPRLPDAQALGNVGDVGGYR